MSYQWNQLATMFGQLGIAAKRLGNDNPMDKDDGVHSIVVEREESTSLPNEVATLTLPEPI